MSSTTATSDGAGQGSATDHEITSSPTDGSTTSAGESSTPDRCDQVQVPQPSFHYNTGLVERQPTDTVTVRLDRRHSAYTDRYSFELSPSQLVPATYTVPVTYRCLEHDEGACGYVVDRTESVVLEVMELTDCFVARFLDVEIDGPEDGCTDFFGGCGGFVEPVVSQ